MSTSSVVKWDKMSCLNFLRLIASLSDITRTQSSNTYRVVLSLVLMSDMMSGVTVENGIAGPVGSPHIHIRSASVPPLMMPPQRSTMWKMFESVVLMVFLILSVEILVKVSIFLRLLRNGCSRPDDESGFYSYQ